MRTERSMISSDLRYLVYEIHLYYVFVYVIIQIMTETSVIMSSCQQDTAISFKLFPCPTNITQIPRDTDANKPTAIHVGVIAESASESFEMIYIKINIRGLRP